MSCQNLFSQNLRHILSKFTLSKSFGIFFRNLVWSVQMDSGRPVGFERGLVREIRTAPQVPLMQPFLTTFRTLCAQSVNFRHSVKIPNLERDSGYTRRVPARFGPRALRSCWLRLGSPSPTWCGFMIYFV